MSGPTVVLTYCTKCRWLLRAQWYAAELLSTFDEPLTAAGGQVALAPDDTGGVFRVELLVEGDRQEIWNRKRDGGFPEITELKRRVRDLIAPQMSLGHADKDS